MTFVLMFLLIFLSGAAVLVGLILGIVGLSTDKKTMRNWGFIVFGVGLIILLSSIVYSVRAAVHKVQEGVEQFKDMADSLNNYDYEDASITDDVRNYLLDDTCTNETMVYIRRNSVFKSHDIQDSYYTYFGSASFSRMPLIYPYALHCWDSKDYGTLVNEKNVADIQYTPGGEENIILNVKRVNFDQRFILMHTVLSQDFNDPSSDKYVLFDMEKNLTKEFNSEKDLFKAAKKSGYEGSEELMTLWDYDKKF